MIDDDAIYRMAERLPDTRAQLEALCTLPPKTVERHGESLLALIAVTREQAAAKLLADDELSGEQKQRLRELQNFVQARAAELQLPSGYQIGRASCRERVCPYV